MLRYDRVIPVALFALLVSLSLPACGGGDGEEGQEASRVEGGSEVLATFAGGELTLEDFEAEADKLPPQVKPMLTSPERRRQYLENLIVSKLLIADARSRGVDKDEEIRRQIEETENRLILQKAYRDLQDSVTITDEDVAAQYNENTDAYSTSEVRASHILVEDESIAEDLLKRLKEDPDSFAQLAKNISKDTATASREGDLGFFGRGRMVPDFEKAAFALKEPGDLSGVVKSPFGYHIIKLTERKAGDTKPLEQVKEQIRFTLLQERQRQTMQDYIERLKAENQVKINDEVLARYSATPAPRAAQPEPSASIPPGDAGKEGESSESGETGK